MYPQGVQFLYTGIFLHYLKEEQHKENGTATVANQSTSCEELNF